MKAIPTTLAGLATTALLISGCGGGNQGSADTNTGKLPTSSRATPPRETGPQASSGGVVRVAMQGIKFVPANVTVKKGQKIEWANNDPVAHTVTADSGAEFDSGTLSARAKYSYTPTKPGKIHYFCTIHGQQQSGTITVTG